MGLEFIDKRQPAGVAGGFFCPSEGTAKPPRRRSLAQTEKMPAA